MNTKLKESLRSYGGPLTPEQVGILRDMQGWIEYCIANGLSLNSALQVLGHDAYGLLREGSEVMPQSSGYAKYLSHPEDLSEMANDPDPNDE